MSFSPFSSSFRDLDEDGLKRILEKVINELIRKYPLLANQNRQALIDNVAQQIKEASDDNFKSLSENLRTNPVETIKSLQLAVLDLSNREPGYKSPVIKLAFGKQNYKKLDDPAEKNTLKNDLKELFKKNLERLNQFNENALKQHPELKMKPNFKLSDYKLEEKEIEELAERNAAAMIAKMKQKNPELSRMNGSGSEMKGFVDNLTETIVNLYGFDIRKSGSMPIPVLTIRTITPALENFSIGGETNTSTMAKLKTPLPGDDELNLKDQPLSNLLSQTLLPEVEEAIDKELKVTPKYTMTPPIK